MSSSCGQAKILVTLCDAYINKTEARFGNFLESKSKQPLQDSGIPCKVSIRIDQNLQDKKHVASCKELSRRGDGDSEVATFPVLKTYVYMLFWLHFMLRYWYVLHQREVRLLNDMHRSY